MGRKKKRGGNKTVKPAENIEEDTENMHNVVTESKDEEEKGEKYTVYDLMTRVNEYLENFNHEMALLFCQKALAMEPNNVKVLECYGNVCAEVGDIEKAKKYFNDAVNIQPNKGHVKYLYLGQLHEGLDAVKFYEKGIELMKHVIQTEENNQEDLKQRTLTNTDIANVYCSIAEIFMTDCCMEEDAEELCEKYCKLAIEIDSKSLDASVGMCNLLLNQCKMDDAKASTLTAFELWSTFSKETSEEMIPEVMSYEARVTLIKLLIEVECYDKVSVIVDQLIEENEDDLRIWYYLGLAKSLLKDTDNPRFYLEKALELFEKTGLERDEMVDHIEELLKDCPPDDDMEMIEEEDEEEVNEAKDNLNSMDVEE